jgi:hypothetical protein
MSALVDESASGDFEVKRRNVCMLAAFQHGSSGVLWRAVDLKTRMVHTVFVIKPSS